VRLEQVAQSIPGLILELGDSLVDFTQNLETDSERASRYVYICDDGVEKLDAAFHVRSMRCGPADGYRPPYEKIQVVVGKDLGIKLADVGGILEGSEHVGDVRGRIGGTPLAVRLTLHATESIAAGLEAAVQGGQNEGDNARLAGIDVAPIVGESGDDFKSLVKKAIVLA
jgi:hypothetical protein